MTVCSQALMRESNALVTHGTRISRLSRRLATSLAISIVAVSASASAQNHSRTDQIVYHDNTSLWVLGQVASSTNTNTGVIEFRSEFDAAKAMPLRYYGAGTASVPGKLVQTLTYNADGTVATVKDGNNKVTTLSNWYRGIPQNIQHPDSTTQSAVVSAQGWITSVTDENGYKTCYAYDAMGRMSQVTYPSESVVNTCDTTTWAATTQAFQSVAAAEYGIPAGHWRQTVSTGNARKITYYDALWRPLVTREYDTANEAGTQRFQRFAYDHEGRVIFASYPGVTDSLSTGTWTGYDALGRTRTVSQDSEHGLLTTLTEYLPGFQTRVTNPRGQKTLTIYQVFDQPTYDFPAGISELGGDRHTEIYRDVFGKVTALRRRNGDASTQVWRHYVYDANQQLCKTVEPETGATIMDYDGAGNLQWSAAGLSGGNYVVTTDCSFTDAWNSGRRVDRSYDARNRLNTLTFADGLGNQAWTYTPDGLPATITTHNSLPSIQGGQQVINAYAYNRRRLMVGESLTQKDWYTWGVGYGYDANASLASQSFYDGSTVSYHPNALGQATRVKDHTGFVFASDAKYYPNGAVKQFTYGNGIVHSMVQNARQLPARSVDSGVLDLDTRFDANGNVSDVYDIARGGFYNRHMQYDGLDRLAAAGSWVFGGDAWHRFTYDALDNMTSWKLPGVKDYAQYVYNAQNRLTNIKNSGGATVVGLEYDAQGNLKNKSGQNYDFDIGNRLREVSGKEYYRYDGHGRRVMAWRPNLGSVLSQYTSDGKVFFQWDEIQNKRQYHLYLGNNLVATREVPLAGGALTTKYQHTDALGSPVAVTNESGMVIERHDYEPYGAVIGKPHFQGIGYTGHVQDAATGLTYMQQRYYDPQVGLFLSVDPVRPNARSGRNFNRYAYANNNPYRFTDPDGRFAKGRDEPPPPPPTELPPVTVTPQSQPTTLGTVTVTAPRPISMPRPAPIPWARIGTGLANFGKGLSGPLLFLYAPHPCNGEPCGELVYNSELGDVKPGDAPAGTLGLDEAKRKYNWSKDKAHEIKDAATGGMAGGRTWVGVAPDGTVGINEGGQWSPQGTADELSP